MNKNNQRNIENKVFIPTPYVGSSVNSINDCNFKCIRSNLLLEYCRPKEG